MGCMGTKAGMTTWFLTNGDAIPCTVIAIEEGNIVTQVKSQNTDGYSAVQIGYKTAGNNKITKPQQGHLKKVGAPNLSRLTEYRMEKLPEVQLGEGIVVSSLFREG